nr:hypothetical protein [Verrucomicrobiota bacterium JB025]
METCCLAEGAGRLTDAEAVIPIAAVTTACADSASFDCPGTGAHDHFSGLFASKVNPVAGLLVGVFAGIAAWLEGGRRRRYG